MTLYASGVTPVTGTFTATGSSASFSPILGRDFNITISGGVGAVVVERSFDNGTTWYAVITDALRIALPESFTLNESEPSLYRVRCTTFTSGTFTYRISQ